MSVQGVMNTRLQEHVGLWEANAYVQGTAFALSLVVMWLFGTGNLGALASAPRGYLLGGGNGVLYLPQAVEVFTLFLCHLQLESGHFLVLGFCHGLGSGFQSFAGNLQGLTDPRGRRDTDGNADDAQEFHHVHAAPSEHHHPAFVGAYTERQQQADDACQSDGITQHRHIGKGFHGDQQLVQTLVNGRQSDG